MLVYVCVCILPSYNSAALDWPWLWCERNPRFRGDLEGKHKATTETCESSFFVQHTYCTVSAQRMNTCTLCVRLDAIIARQHTHTHLGPTPTALCKLFIRGSDWEWSSLLGHNRAEVFMNKGMGSGCHRHEYPITNYFWSILLFIYLQTRRKKKKKTFSADSISLVFFSEQGAGTERAWWQVTESITYFISLDCFHSSPPML